MKAIDWGVVAVAAATFGVLALRPDQPIVENYVGRQIPTAMVARNLERGSGFGDPQLDTGPFPNRFLVEPPAFAASAVGLRWAMGWPLEACGRLVSAAGMAAGVWGLMGLVARRRGRWAALAAGLALASMPVVLRYGRAFQPDALMVGALLLGVSCWDAAEAKASMGRRILAVLALALAFACKVTCLAVALPVLVAITPRRRRLAWLIVASVPTALWYLHAAGLLRAGEGSRATGESAAIWAGALIPAALVRWETYVLFGRYVFLRTFGPLAWVLAAGAWRRGIDRLWLTWGLAAGGLMLALAAKAHHEYYWLLLAPPLAAGIGQAVAAGGRGWRALAACHLVLGPWLAADTFRTPTEWARLEQAAASVRRAVPAEDWVIAPEALIYYADRRGCRLEFSPAAARRAAREWPDGPETVDAVGLVDWYLHAAPGAGAPAVWFADLVVAQPEAGRRALHDAIGRGDLPLGPPVAAPGVVLMAKGGQR